MVSQELVQILSPSSEPVSTNPARTLRGRSVRFGLDTDRLTHVATRFFKRRWEQSRGDQYDAWGASTWFFEIEDDGYPVRQIEAYDRGPTLRYGPGHDEDEYGFLSYAQFEEDEDWARWEITPAEFEQAWASPE